MVVHMEEMENIRNDGQEVFDGEVGNDISDLVVGLRAASLCGHGGRRKRSGGGGKGGGT